MHQELQRQRTIAKLGLKVQINLEEFKILRRMNTTDSERVLADATIGYGENPPDLTIRFYFGLAEGDGATGRVVAGEPVAVALAAGITGAPGAGTAGALGFTGAGEAAG